MSYAINTQKYGMRKRVFLWAWCWQFPCRAWLEIRKHVKSNTTSSRFNHFYVGTHACVFIRTTLLLCNLYARCNEQSPSRHGQSRKQDGGRLASFPHSLHPNIWGEAQMLRVRLCVVFRSPTFLFFWQAHAYAHRLQESRRKLAT